MKIKKYIFIIIGILVDCSAIYPDETTKDEYQSKDACKVGKGPSCPAPQRENLPH
jgi:hypothetical protein